MEIITAGRVGTAISIVGIVQANTFPPVHVGRSIHGSPINVWSGLYKAAKIVFIGAYGENHFVPGGSNWKVGHSYLDFYNNFLSKAN